jgi:calcium channel MID1
MLTTYDADPLHQHLDARPFLGDTTSNEALVFSPPFAPISPEQPSYPNYTLPPANLSLPSPPSSPNFTLILAPTSSSLSVPQTGCRLSAIQSSGNELNQTLWLRDQTGWRSQWLIGGLNPATNYTAFVVQDSTKVSGPIYFLTKSGEYKLIKYH